MKLGTSVRLSHISQQLALGSAKLALGKVTLSLSNSLKQSAVNKPTSMSLACGLRTPSLRAIFGVVPRDILGHRRLATGKRIALRKALGKLCNGRRVPRTALRIDVGRTSTGCTSLPCNVSSLATRFDKCISFVHRGPSCTSLGVFHFGKTRASVLTSKGIRSLLNSPSVAFRAHSRVSLATLTGAFPLRRKISVNNQIKTSFHLRYHLSAVRGRS